MKNPRNIRSFLCGMLATALLVGLVGPAVAASHVNKQLYYNDIKVRLNGKVLFLAHAYLFLLFGRLHVRHLEVVAVVRDLPKRFGVLHL